VSAVLAVLSGEAFVRCTTARQRRIFNWVAFEVWITGGTAVWVILRSQLWFVGFMSLYAIVWGHFLGWAAETPVEREDED